MSFHLQYKRYKRQATHPLQTHQKLWQEREGIIVRLQSNDGKEGFGEIVPMPDRSNETVDAVESILKKFDGNFQSEQLAQLPQHMQATRWGLTSARAWALEQLPPVIAKPFAVSRLISGGTKVLDQFKHDYHEGYRYFKWKIAVANIADELKTWERLSNQLPKDIKLRLDANGGLSLDEAKRWLDTIEGDERIEFLEQPLATTALKDMFKLNHTYLTDIALDESAQTLNDLQQLEEQKWTGLIVVKLSAVGDYNSLIQWQSTSGLRRMYSTALETDFGMWVALRVAMQDHSSHYALGFGTQGFFENDGLNVLFKPKQGMLTLHTVSESYFNDLWNQL